MRELQDQGWFQLIRLTVKKIVEKMAKFTVKKSVET